MTPCPRPENTKWGSADALHIQAFPYNVSGANHRLVGPNPGTNRNLRQQTSLAENKLAYCRRRHLATQTTTRAIESGKNKTYCHHIASSLPPSPSRNLTTTHLTFLKQTQNARPSSSHPSVNRPTPPAPSCSYFPSSLRASRNERMKRDSLTRALEQALDTEDMRRRRRHKGRNRHLSEGSSVRNLI